ncbi:MAG: NADase-type glycan-binding domain-containing protein [Janthinobacterium lividum]
MAATSSNGKIWLYIIGGLVALWLGAVLLVLLYYLFSYLGLNLFLGLDSSAFGQLAPSPVPGYALLGLGLGAAAGAVAAQRRFRLNKHIQTGVGALVLGLLAVAVVGNPAHFAPLAEEAQEAGVYEPGEGWGQCPACTTIAASSTKADPGENRYAATKLLDKNPATAWISEAGTTHTLQLALTIPADQQLVGLRISNGYGKNEGVYTSFSRARTCRVRLDSDPEARWTLPDTHSQDLFIPLEVADDATPAVLFFYIDNLYPGENHPEVALSGLTPVIKARH